MNGAINEDGKPTFNWDAREPASRFQALRVAMFLDLNEAGDNISAEWCVRHTCLPLCVRACLPASACQQQWRQQQQQRNISNDPAYSWQQQGRRWHRRSRYCSHSTTAATQPRRRRRRWWWRRRRQRPLQQHRQHGRRTRRQRRRRGHVVGLVACRVASTARVAR